MTILRTQLMLDLWSCLYTGNDVKVKDHCHITGKYRVSIDCNINVELNLKIPVVFDSLESFDSRLSMQELGKFNLKVNVIPNGLEMFMSFSINNKLSFTDSFLSYKLEISNF